MVPGSPGGLCFLSSLSLVDICRRVLHRLIWGMRLFRAVFLLAGLLIGGSERVGAQAPASAGDNRLQPGDLIRLRIWREDELSGEFMVDARGKVVFPRLGEYQVMNETQEQLVGRLIEDYRKYLLNPSIEITILRRINILGAVTKPGVYNIDPTVTIADALALAGGVTPLGNGDAVRVLRNGQPLDLVISQRTRVGDSPLQSGDQIFVPERSLLRQNTGLLAALVSAVVTVTVALILR